MFAKKKGGRAIFLVAPFATPAENEKNIGATIHIGRDMGDFLYWFDYLHTSRDSLSLVWGIVKPDFMLIIWFVDSVLVIISFLTMEYWNQTLQYFLGARGILLPVALKYTAASGSEPRCISGPPGVFNRYLNIICRPSIILNRPGVARARARARP